MNQFVVTEEEVQALLEHAFQQGYRAAQAQRFQPVIVMEEVNGVYVEVSNA